MSLETVLTASVGNVRSQHAFPGTGLRGCFQLALELPHLALHSADVYSHGIWCILLLRIIDDVLHRLRVLPRP